MPKMNGPVPAGDPYALCARQESLLGLPGGGFDEWKAEN